MAATTTAKKKVFVPMVGDYATDGEVLVEVTGKSRDGWVVVDVRSTLDGVPETTIIVPADLGLWRPVTPEPEPEPEPELVEVTDDGS